VISIVAGMVPVRRWHLNRVSLRQHPSPSYWPIGQAGGTGPPPSYARWSWQSPAGSPSPVGGAGPGPERRDRRL